MKKKTAFKLLSLLLALIFCFGCFAACGDKEGDEKGDDSSDTSAVENTTSGFTIGGGKASFTVVVPKNSPEPVEMALETLLSAFETKTGTRPEAGNDYLMKGKIYDTSTFEILLGRTKHDQTKDVLSELENGQFAIRVVGKKIIITAPSDADIAAAVDYFVANYVNGMTESDGAYSLNVTDYTSEAVAGNTAVTINGADIGEYRIIYESERVGYEEVAIRLRDKMKELGYEVTVGKDSVVKANDGAKEILIGKTNRSVSSTLYGTEPVKLMTYKLVVSGSYLQLVCGGPYSARECVNAMPFHFFGVENKTFTDGEYMVTDMNVEENKFAEGTDLRIMTSNVLAARWTDSYEDCPETVARAEVFAACLMTSKPDVIGVQEADNEWIQYMPYYLDYLKTNCGIEYEWIFEDWKSDAQKKANVKNGQTITSVMYRSDKYEHVESGIENCAWWTTTEYNLRLVEWAMLRDKVNTARRFIIMNTHWGFETEAAGEASRTQSVELSINTAKKLAETYPNVPIFHTGDFNSNHRSGGEGSEYVDMFLAQTGFKDSMLVALEKGVRVNDCGGCAGVGAIRGTGYSYIDHIAYLGNTVNVLKYETLAGKNIYFTDHLPHIADFDIWS